MLSKHIALLKMLQKNAMIQKLVKKYDHLRNLPMEVNLCGYKMLNEFKIFDHINLKSDFKSCVIVPNVGFNDIIYRLH